MRPSAELVGPRLSRREASVYHRALPAKVADDERGVAAAVGRVIDAEEASETWLGMQLAYDLSRTRDLERTIKVDRINAA